ncbi:hypothetical protein ABDK56_12545 [Sphingomonas sp. ASV193]|uniref:hypothetical protein n=1 Tax=Sphingomonas sp. ASV193 TaxID=3144405 RepID=UPI0032E86BDF
MARLLLIFLSALSLAACKAPPPGETYALDEATVKARLAEAEVPLMVFGEAGAKIDVERSEEDDGRKISWALVYDGDEMFRYLATIAPETPTATHVSVQIMPGEGDKAQKTYARMKANADIAAMYGQAMLEEVDSKIEQRRFSMAPVYQKMMVAAFNHRDHIFPRTDSTSNSSAKSSESAD